MLPAPAPSVVFQKLADGAVLFSPGTEIYFGLNEVGARVWALLPPVTNSLDELCARLAAEYPDASPEDIRRDVAELLTSLEGERLASRPGSSADGATPP